MYITRRLYRSSFHFTKHAEHARPNAAQVLWILVVRHDCAVLCPFYFVGVDVSNGVRITCVAPSDAQSPALR